MSSKLNCKDIDVEVIPDDPFRNDALNRQRFASVLNSVIDIYSDTGIVLSLNGEWGSGKTTFVRMWRQQLIDNGYRTLYFNAWKTDFSDDALSALLGELKTEFPHSERFKNIVEKGAKISLNIGEAVAKGVLRKLTGIEADAISAGISTVKEQFVESVESYSKRKTDLEDFKQSLSEFVASESNGKPVIFFIDELDRCNPSYAVQVLERVKHLFEVPNIVFVVAINEKQLQYAVQGFYGSNNIDGQEYLRRFFDISFTLPTPDLAEYAKVLFERHNFDSFFSFPRNNYYDNYNFNNKESEIFISFAGDVLAGSNMNLRLANKIFAYTRLALYSYGIGANICSDTFFLLCYLKVTNPQFFDDIKMGAFSIQELIDELEKQLPPGIFASETDMFTPRHTAWAIAGLIAHYSYSDRGIERDTTFKGEQNGDSKDLVFPLKTAKINKGLLDEALTYIMRSNRHYMNGLKNMIEKIELSGYLRF